VLDPVEAGAVHEPEPAADRGPGLRRGALGVDAGEDPVGGLAADLGDKVADLRHAGRGADQVAVGDRVLLDQREEPVEAARELLRR